MFTIIASKPNAASMNIAQRLLENFEWHDTGREFDGGPVRVHKNIEFAFTNALHVFADNVGALPTECFVFISSHKSAAGHATLSVHPIGNWGKAELGGRDRGLVPTNPALAKNFLRLLQEKKDAMNLAYDVSLEATHHGPFLKSQALFIEIGSSPKQWGDEKAALAVAETIMQGTAVEGNFVNCVGLGGQHYPLEFTKLVLRTDFALGHICPKHALHLLDEELLKQAIACSNANAIVLDWKGLGKEKVHVMDLVSKQGLQIERVQKLLK